MSVTKQIQEQYNKGHQIGYDEIARLAMAVFKRYVRPVEFYMAMGTYFFVDIHHRNFNNDEYCRDISKIIDEWDTSFNFTGHPLHITAAGGVDKDY